MQPKATLIGKPENPIGLLYFIWIQSRSQGQCDSPEYYSHMAQESFVTGGIGDTVRGTVAKILNEGIPVTECLYFTFYLENVPVSLREQLVRHRIGCHVGPEMGYDIIPDLATSTFWSQTSRAVSQSDFAEEERYIIPDQCKVENYSEENSEAYEVYRDAMRHAEYAYNKLIEEGVPMEDARQVLPLAATQTMTWTLSLKTIQHVLGNRACWIAQSNLWAPIISDMQRELSKVSPMFDGLVSPPCFERGKYKECPFKLVNEDRLAGKEDYLPCPMYMYHETNRLGEVEYPNAEISKFERLWGRDAFSGQIIKLEVK
jgi:thymidylate synthase ThyX